MPDVSVRLKDIDEDNWMDVVMLSTSDENPRILEEYVASNALSICQALFEGTWTIRAIYCGRKPVGFAMYGYCEEREQYELCRLMIDHNHQGKGLGSIALKLVIQEMREIEGCEKVFLLVHRENEKARSIYTRNGFKPTGIMVGDEEMYYIALEGINNATDRT